MALTIGNGRIQRVRYPRTPRTPTREYQYRVSEEERRRQRIRAWTPQPRRVSPQAAGGASIENIYRLFRIPQRTAEEKVEEEWVGGAAISAAEAYYPDAIFRWLNRYYQDRPEWFVPYGEPIPTAPTWQTQLPEWQPVSGVGGLEELPEPKFTLADILEHLEFPAQWQYPTYLRDFGRYLEELLTQNPQFAIPTPELTAEGAIIPSPEDLEELEYMESAKKYAAAWDEFLSALLTLPFFQQQVYLGLRYTPETSWYRSGQVPLLPHPEFL